MGGGVKDVINLADLPEQLDDFKVLIFEIGDGCLFVLREGGGASHCGLDDQQSHTVPSLGMARSLKFCSEKVEYNP